MNSTRAVLSRAALSTAGMTVQGLARFAYTLAIGRLAGPEALGETTALLSVAVYLSLAWPAGAGIAASRYLPSPEGGGALSLLNRSFWVSSVSLSLIAVPLAWWITDDIVLAVTCAILVFSYNAYVYTRGVLMGEDRILWSAIADTLSSLVAITALVLALAGDITWALLLPLAAGYLLFAATSRPRTKPAPIGAVERRTVLSFTAHATIGTLVTGGLLPATMVFVRAFDAPTQAGLFAAGLSLATPANLVSQAVNQVLVPHFVRLRDDEHALRRTHLRFFLLTAGPFAVMFGLLIALAPWLLTFFYGDLYAGGTAPMQALLIVVMLISATCAPAALLIATDHQKLFARVWTIAFIVGMVAMAALSPLWGQWGALAGFALGGGGGSIAIIVAGFTAGRRKPLKTAD